VRKTKSQRLPQIWFGSISCREIPERTTFIMDRMLRTRYALLCAMGRADEATGRPTRSKESEENPHLATTVHMEPFKKVQPSTNCIGRALSSAI
jgi:hypothetical protein